MVFAEQYLYYRYMEGRRRGFEEGVLSERARWEDYLDSVEEAHRLGNPPPAPPGQPTESKNGHRRP